MNNNQIKYIKQNTNLLSLIYSIYSSLLIKNENIKKLS